MSFRVAANRIAESEKRSKEREDKGKERRPQVRLQRKAVINVCNEKLKQH